MIQEFIRRLFFIPPKLPETVQIGITNRCNFNCKMCQRKDLNVDIKDMDIELYKKIISEIKKISDKFNNRYLKNLILTGWGEPFLHPQLFEMIKIAKDNNFLVRLTSNGFFLNSENIEKIFLSKLDAITFSIDEINHDEDTSGHPVSIQLKGIKELLDRRQLLLEENKNINLKVYFQSTYHKNKKDKIFEVLDWAQKNYVDRLRVSRLDIRFKKFDRPNLEEEKRLVQKVDFLIKNKKIGFDFLPHTALDGFTRKLYRIFYPLLHRKGRYCLRTFSDLYINVSGEITPCCGLPKFSFGNILESDLEVLWNGCKFKNFRENYKNFCGKCDILAIKPYL